MRVLRDFERFPILVENGAGSAEGSLLISRNWPARFTTSDTSGTNDNLHPALERPRYFEPC